jgi:hypothetical protein
LQNNSWSGPGSVTTTSSDTALPTGLTDKSTVVAFIHFDDMIYSSSKNGTKEQVLQFLSNSFNWQNLRDFLLLIDHFQPLLCKMICVATLQWHTQIPNCCIFF